MPRFLRQGSVLIQYLLSYIGIAIFSCAIIGIVAFNLFINNLEETELNNTRHKMELALQDLETQLATLQRISYDVSFDIKYHPLYFRQNKYLEVTMLEDFAKYKGFSPIVSEYFLKYHDDDAVFLSTGFTNPSAVYFQQALGSDAPGAFRDTIDTVDGMAVLPVSGKIVIAYPLRIVSDRSTVNRATMGFVTSPQLLKDRLLNVSGRLEGAIALSIQGEAILWEESAQADDPLIAIRSVDGSLSMTLALPRESVYGSINRFRVINLMAIALITLLIAALASLLAYRNFMPIKRIHAKFQKDPASDAGRNELTSLEALFLKTLESHERTAEQMTRQMRLLREQSLRLLLSGDQSTLTLLRQLGIQPTRDFFAVYELREPARAEALDPEAWERIPAHVEDLSDANLQFYAVPGTKPRGVTILVNMADEMQQEEAQDLLHSVLDLEESAFVMGASRVYSAVGHLPVAALEAVADCEENISRSQGSARDDWERADPLHYDRKYVSRMLRSVRTGNYPEACEQLDQFIAHTFPTVPSILLQRYIFSDVLVSLVQESRELKTPVSPQMTNAVLGAQDVASFREGITAILKALCYRSESTTKEKDLFDAVMCHIQEHYTDYDISLETIALAFGLSANYVSRLIKRLAHENYKDYVTQLRIGKAKELLLKGMSVTQTCELIGYANISHFIKTFKNETGVTPANYKKQAQRA